MELKTPTNMINQIWSSMWFEIIITGPFADKIQDTEIHITLQGNKRVYQANKCLECPFHKECSPKKYKTFLESPHSSILETKKNFIAAEELLLYKYRGIIRKEDLEH